MNKTNHLLKIAFIILLMSCTKEHDTNIQKIINEYGCHSSMLPKESIVLSRPYVVQIPDAAVLGIDKAAAISAVYTGNIHTDSRASLIKILVSINQQGVLSEEAFGNLSEMQKESIKSELVKAIAFLREYEIKDYVVFNDQRRFFLLNDQILIYSARALSAQDVSEFNTFKRVESHSNWYFRNYGYGGNTR